LPPDGPELNPIERVWRDLKTRWPGSISLVEMGHKTTSAICWQAYEAAMLQSLTGYTYLVEAFMHYIYNEVI